MDPRHPELAVSRIKELINQYDRIEADMSKATTSAQLAKLEREGGLVVQEICLVAPRIHEAMMQASRQRRHDLSRGILEKCDKTSEIGRKNVMTPVPEEKVGKYIKATIALEEKHVEKSATQMRKKAISKKETATKKTTRKKKTTKKAEK